MNLQSKSVPSPKSFQSRRSSLSLLQLLTILEWILLSISAISQIMFIIVTNSPNLLIDNVLGLGAFTALGRITPQRNFSKYIYTSIEFGLVFYLMFFGKLIQPTILFVIIGIRNCVFWQKPYREWVTVLTFLGSVIGLSHKIFNRSIFLNLPSERIGVIWIGAFFSIGLVILFLYLLIKTALIEHYRQQELTIANGRLREYALRIEDLATVQERNRIARDIHDSLGHSLTIFSIHLQGALRLLRSNPKKAEELLLELQQLNSKTLGEIRQSITVLRSDPLKEKSLPEAITELIKEFEKSAGLAPEFNYRVQSPLTHDVNVVIYRIIQESLTNIRKHAQPTKVSISIIQSHRELVITIVDNGAGFDLSQNTTGFGLEGMRERAMALMGKLEVITAPSEGCRMVVTVPISG